ncbi:MAG: hypothetical protein JXR88_10915 [Clostridia bacterium]|nr:hypothetical protein [Clostridia bacterium]
MKKVFLMLLVITLLLSLNIVFANEDTTEELDFSEIQVSSKGVISNETQTSHIKYIYEH